jgi:copper chaperone CopZ
MEEAKGTVWLGLSTILTAFAASLCCILPLAVAALGAGSAALGTWLAPWRPVFLVATVVLLGFAFYREYRSGASCADSGEGCRPAASRRRLMLWVVTALILTLVTFPYYGGAIAAGQGANDEQVAKAVFRVQGMSCSGCEATMEIALKKLDGVESVKASYDEGRAEISYRPSQVGVQKIQQAIEQLGYKAERVELPAVERAPVSGRSASGKPALRDLESLDELMGLFRQTRGQPRIVLLLSPT